MLRKHLLCTSDFEKDFNFKPKISLNEGINKFIEWYKTQGK